MFDSRDVLPGRCGTWGSLAGRNCAECCVFPCFSIVLIVLWLWKARKVSFQKGSCGGSAAPDVAKICTTLRRESDLGSQNRQKRLSNRLNLKAIESEIIWIWNHLNPTSVESQVTFLNLKSLESQIHWISNQMKCKTVESEISWRSNQLNSTPSSYRFLIFGNFRHRIVR